MENSFFIRMCFTCFLLILMRDQPRLITFRWVRLIYQIEIRETLGFSKDFEICLFGAKTEVSDII